jgi:hypothetical protein
VRPSTRDTIWTAWCAAQTATAISQQTVVNHVHVYLDGKPFDDKIDTRIESAFNELASSITRQRG